MKFVTISDGKNGDVCVTQVHQGTRLESAMGREEWAEITRLVEKSFEVHSGTGCCG